MPFRRVLLAAGLAVAALLAAGQEGAPLAPAPAAAASANAQDRVERAIVRRVNRVRRSHGLRRLRTSARLASAADDHSLAMLRSDVLSHSSPDGTPMARRVRRYVRARSVGETIAWISPRTRRKARVVVRAWMGSPSHRAALLSRRFRRIGVGRRTGRIGRSPLMLTTLDLASAR